MKSICLTCVFLLSLLISATGSAAAITAEPIRVVLSPEKPIVSQKIHNVSDAPVLVQLHAVKWSQQKGQDIYQKTNEVLVMPPACKIAAHDTQIVRVGLRQRPQVNSEMAYRIIIQEVPSKIKQTKESMVRTVLQLRIPVFVKPLTEQKHLNWQVVRLKNNQIKVRLNNLGNTHIQVSKLGLAEMNDGKPRVLKQVLNYVLPGQSQEWQFNFPSSITHKTINLYAVTDWGNIIAPVQVIS